MPTPDDRNPQPTEQQIKELMIQTIINSDEVKKVTANLVGQVYDQEDKDKLKKSLPAKLRELAEQKVNANFDPSDIEGSFGKVLEDIKAIPNMDYWDRYAEAVKMLSGPNDSYYEKNVEIPAKAGVFATDDKWKSFSSLSGLGTQEANAFQTALDAQYPPAAVAEEAVAETKPKPVTPPPARKTNSTPAPEVTDPVVTADPIDPVDQAPAPSDPSNPVVSKGEIPAARIVPHALKGTDLYNDLMDSSYAALGKINNRKAGFESLFSQELADFSYSEYLELANKGLALVIATASSRLSVNADGSLNTDEYVSYLKQLGGDEDARALALKEAGFSDDQILQFNELIENGGNPFEGLSIKAETYANQAANNFAELSGMSAEEVGNTINEAANAERAYYEKLLAEAKEAESKKQTLDLEGLRASLGNMGQIGVILEMVLELISGFLKGDLGENVQIAEEAGFSINNFVNDAGALQLFADGGRQFNGVDGISNIVLEEGASIMPATQGQFGNYLQSAAKELREAAKDLNKEYDAFRNENGDLPADKQEKFRKEFAAAAKEYFDENPYQGNYLVVKPIQEGQEIPEGYVALLGDDDKPVTNRAGKPLMQMTDEYLQEVITRGGVDSKGLDLSSVFGGAQIAGGEDAKVVDQQFFDIDYQALIDKHYEGKT